MPYDSGIVLVSGNSGMNNDTGMWVSWGRDWSPVPWSEFTSLTSCPWFVSGFFGGDLPLLWTLHHWWGEISELHLWSAPGLFVKHDCLPGPESSLDSEKVKFISSLCSFCITFDGWSLLEVCGLLEPLPKGWAEARSRIWEERSMSLLQAGET